MTFLVVFKKPTLSLAFNWAKSFVLLLCKIIRKTGLIWLTSYWKKLILLILVLIWPFWRHFITFLSDIAWKNGLMTCTVKSITQCPNLDRLCCKSTLVSKVSFKRAVLINNSCLWSCRMPFMPTKYSTVSPSKTFPSLLRPIWQPLWGFWCSCSPLNPIL